MYQRTKNSWIKHIDFVILDILCLQVSFFMAYLVRHRNLNVYSNSVYGNLAIVLILIDVCMMFFLNTCKNVLKRGLLIELAATMRQVSLVILFAVFYLFFVKDAGDFSRITLFLTAIFYAIISYGIRILWKRHVLRNLRLGKKNSIVILTDWASLPQIREDIENHSYDLFQIRGIAVIDVNENKTLPEKLGDIPFVAEGESVMDYLCHAWVDEVFIDLQPSDKRVDGWIDQLTEMGVTVHLKLANRMDLAANKQFVENLGRYTVLTTSIRTVSIWELFLKRLLDILGGIVGCIITGILLLILAPMIYHESPGPIFFGQTRIGKNGKKFTCYKFRSMYLDAEERKAVLAAENRVSDGMMFKLDFDPRIIGSRRLPDGTIKKGLGNKIRDWSIDEFPQFWNVLKGEMSLVGTRPPTEDEWVKYKLHHRSRLAIKPGITGMWQVSGRSKITDFEQVVALEGGTALAEVLFGAVNPSGKLAETLPEEIPECFRKEAYFPGRPLTDEEKKHMNAHLTQTYAEGIFVGYRYYEKNRIPVQFCFGHGLSYTDFTYDNLKIEEIPSKARANGFDVQLQVRNVGALEGKETVQLYLGEKTVSPENPVKELKAFEKICLRPRETKTVLLKITMEDFMHYDEAAGTWRLKHGDYRIYVGSSLQDIQLTQDITI